MKIAVLATCFNRVDTTILGLSKLDEATKLCTSVEFDWFIVDDASPDGTGDEIRKRFPKANVINGTGDLYWNRGMCLASAAAFNRGAFDAFLLFNDDVVLYPKAFEKLLDLFIRLNEASPAIVVGSTDDGKGTLTYGGWNERSRYRGMSFSRVPLPSTVVEATTFNANCVLVPGVFFRENGGLDPRYSHGVGDIDLGYAAREAGVRVCVAPFFVGSCNVGPSLESRLKGRSIRERAVVLFRHPHGLGPHLYFLWRRKPKVLFPLYFVSQVLGRVGILLRSRR